MNANLSNPINDVLSGIGGFNAFSDVRTSAPSGPIIISPLTVGNLAAMNNAVNAINPSNLINPTNPTNNSRNAVALNSLNSLRSNLNLSDPQLVSLPQQMANCTQNMNPNINNLASVLSGTLNADLPVNNAVNPMMNGLTAIPQTVQSAPTLNGLTVNQLAEAVALLGGTQPSIPSNSMAQGLPANWLPLNANSTGFAAPHCASGGPVGYGASRGQTHCVADNRFSPTNAVHSPMHNNQPVKNLKCLISTDPNSGQLTFSLHFPIT